MAKVTKAAEAAKSSRARKCIKYFGFIWDFLTKNPNKSSIFAPSFYA